MTYATFISQLRTQSGDIRRRVHVDWTGDGTTLIYQMPIDTFPILDQSGTYTIKVNGNTQTETTNFILDKEAGTLVFVSAPANGANIIIDSSAVYLLDATWLQIINDVIKSLGDDFWKEFVDTSNFITTANMLSLSLTASQPNCIAVYEFAHRKTTSENWLSVESYTNWRFDRDNNVIYLGDRNTFTVAGELFKIRGLKTYTLGSAVTDIIDVQDKYLTIIELGSLARYWKYRYKNVVELVSKMTMEQTRTPLQELIMLADRFTREFEREVIKLKPMKPARIIPQFLEDGGRP